MSQQIEIGNFGRLEYYKIIRELEPEDCNRFIRDLNVYLLNKVDAKGRIITGRYG